MSFGQVRQRLPWAELTLLGHTGPFTVEFVVDTGFDGDLALPAHLARRLAAEPSGRRSLALADGTLVATLSYEVILDGLDGPRLMEVLILDGNPLMGVCYMDNALLQVKMTPGGEVLLDLL